MLLTDWLSSFVGNHWATGGLQWTWPWEGRDYKQSFVCLAEGWNAMSRGLCINKHGDNPHDGHEWNHKDNHKDNHKRDQNDPFFGGMGGGVGGLGIIMISLLVSAHLERLISVLYGDNLVLLLSGLRSCHLFLNQWMQNRDRNMTGKKSFDPALTTWWGDTKEQTEKIPRLLASFRECTVLNCTKLHHCKIGVTLYVWALARWRSDSHHIWRNSAHPKVYICCTEICLFSMFSWRTSRKTLETWSEKKSFILQTGHWSPVNARSSPGSIKPLPTCPTDAYPPSHPALLLST